MNNYMVERRDTGEVVYSYGADQATEWPEYPFAEFNHIRKKEAVAQTERMISGVSYMRRFTQTERIAIRAAAAQSSELDDYLKLLDATIAQGDGVDLDDEDIVTAVAKLEQYGLIEQGRGVEIRA